jgi:autoinducer 2-degrading protein
MYVVTVAIEPEPQFAQAFRAAILSNADASRQHEAGCRQFDVCILPGTDTIYLYEVYDDKAAFEKHLGTHHYRYFDAQTREWIVRKDVRIYERIAP